MPSACHTHLATARLVAALLAAVIGAGSIALAGGSLVDGRQTPFGASPAHAAAAAATSAVTSRAGGGEGAFRPTWRASADRC